MEKQTVVEYRQTSPGEAICLKNSPEKGDFLVSYNPSEAKQQLVDLSNGFLLDWEPAPEEPVIVKTFKKLFK